MRNPGLAAAIDDKIIFQTINTCKSIKGGPAIARYHPFILTLPPIPPTPQKNHKIVCSQPEMRLTFLAALHGLCTFVIASPLWPDAHTIHRKHRYQSHKRFRHRAELECYRGSIAHPLESFEKAVDEACGKFSGYVWGVGGWVTQLTHPYWTAREDCPACSRYPIILRADYVGGDQCAPPMELSKNDCKRMMSPIIDTW